MACHRFGAKSLTEPMLAYNQLGHFNEIRIHYLRFKKLENPTCKLAATVSGLQHVNGVVVGVSGSLKRHEVVSSRLMLGDGKLAKCQM